MEIDKEYTKSVEERVANASTEELYEAVRIYLKDRINSGGKEVVNFENEIPCERDFNLYHAEIIRREIAEEKRNSEYMIFFQEMLIQAKIINERMYDVRFYS